MTEQERIELLIGNQGDADRSRIAELERRIIMTIEQKRRRLQRIKLAVAIAWSLVVLLLITGGAVESLSGRSYVTAAIAASLRAGVLIALILSVSWYIRSVSMRFEIIAQTLAQIQDRLRRE